MKRVFIIALLVLCCVPLFADGTSFYMQHDAMFLVDLGATFYMSHSQYAEYGSGDTTSSFVESKYYSKQIIAVLGVSNATEDVTFSISLNSGSWLYLLDRADTTISRPFGLDLFIRGKTSSGAKNIDVSKLTDEEGQAFASGYVIHMGLQEPPAGTAMPSASKITVSITVPYSVLQTCTDNTVWFDVCLVLPELTDGMVTIGGTKYTAKVSDDAYTAQLGISVTSGTALDQSYTIDLTGTYNSSSGGSTDTRLKSMMTVLPTAAATSLNLQGMGSNAISVANYSYQTVSTPTSKISSYASNSAYIYLSSTAEYDTAGEAFKLRRVRDNGSYSPTDNKYNSVTFVAYIVSDSGTSVEFDGTAKKSDSKDNFFEIEPVINNDPSDNPHVRWFSNGTIQVKIAQTESEDVTALTAGKYTETIYIHVVSPE